MILFKTKNCTQENNKHGCNPKGQEYHFIVMAGEMMSLYYQLLEGMAHTQGILFEDILESPERENQCDFFINMLLEANEIKKSIIRARIIKEKEYDDYALLTSIRDYFERGEISTLKEGRKLYKLERKQIGLITHGWIHHLEEMIDTKQNTLFNQIIQIDDENAALFEALNKCASSTRADIDTLEVIKNYNKMIEHRISKYKEWAMKLRS